jgi:ferric-dicitrate binding protein FerR (iron transport regulator)
MTTGHVSEEGSHAPTMLAYLAGTLSETDVREFAARLRGASEVRREFAHVLLEQALLDQIASEGRRGGFSRAARPASRWRLLALSAAAAAAVFAAGGLFLLRSHRYPPPRVAGAVEITGAGVPGRGAVLRTRSESARLVLGGYSSVSIQPFSTLRVQGGERKEEVMLEQGKVVCEVDSRVGRFAVLTRVGRVSAKGTTFSVELRESTGEEPMLKKGVLMMAVVVMLGSVDVNVQGKMYTLSAGQTDLYAAEEGNSGTVVGAVTGKGETWIRVKGDGEEEGKKYIPRWIGGMPAQGGGFDKDMLRKIAAVKVGDRVQVKWLQEEHLRVVELEVLAGEKAAE